MDIFLSVFILTNFLLYAWWKGWSIRHFIETGLPGQTGQDDFAPGEKVRVNFGALNGCEGELVEVKNEKQFIVRIEAINQVLMVSLPLGYLEKIA
jgi:transcription antitermination factor NusG